MTTENKQDKLDALFAIIRRLRLPSGCPWDRKQTPESIKKYLLEETHELVEAIERSDHNNICEEIGDMFYILVMLITMHEEQGKFTSDDVLESISTKMIRRHPHVFSGLKAGSDSELRLQWQKIKAQEKNRNNNQ